LLISQYILLLISQYILLLISQYILLVISQYILLLISQYILLLISQYIFLLMFFVVQNNFFILNPEIYTKSIRQINNFYQPTTNFTLYQKAVHHMGIKIFNNLPPYIKICPIMLGNLKLA
jgi:hypothetical protein